jgi:N-acetylglucosamine kinase-like BadF-type ATPase
MRYFLGVDIGATKSHALIADEMGRAVGFGQSGPGNYESVGWEGLHRALHTITDGALASAGLHRAQIAGAGFGVAGYDWPSERKPTWRAPCEMVNDTIVGLLAGATEGWGVVVVAGTSNNCRGRDREGREGWVTGCGPPFAEYGGAGELVRRAVQMVSLAWSMRGPATRLTDAFVEHTGATGETDLLEGLALQRYQLSAAAAPLVFQMASAGDAVAQEIIHWAGCELGGLANGVIRQLSFEELAFDLVLAGSLYNGGPMLIDPLLETVHQVAPGARLVRLTVPPVVGGVLLGMAQAGIDTAALRPELIASTSELLGRRAQDDV